MSIIGPNSLSFVVSDRALLNYQILSAPKKGLLDFEV